MRNEKDAPARGAARGGADRYFVHEATRLRYRDDGRGCALVLIHGWPLDLELWQPQAEALAASYRVVRMDRRGFGLSEGAPGIEADARDLIALLDELGIERASFVGMSQGARVALSLAAVAADRMECLVLDGAPAVAGLPGQDWEEEIPLDDYRRLLQRHGLNVLRGEMASHALLRLETRNPSMRRLLAGILERYPANDLLVAPSSALHAPALDDVDLPVLVINGSHDTEQRRLVGNALFESLPHSERALVRAAGHLPNLDNPNDYNAILTQFIERHARRKA
jgi:pimeloyl-ACP methyl ester carboxylesterase